MRCGVAREVNVGLSRPARGARVETLVDVRFLFQPRQHPRAPFQIEPIPACLAQPEVLTLAPARAALHDRQRAQRQAARTGQRPQRRDRLVERSNRTLPRRVAAQSVRLHLVERLADRSG